MTLEKKIEVLEEEVRNAQENFALLCFRKDQNYISYKKLRQVQEEIYEELGSRIDRWPNDPPITKALITNYIQLQANSDQNVVIEELKSEAWKNLLRLENKLIRLKGKKNA